MSTKNDMFPATAMPDPDWWQTLWPQPLEILKAIGFQHGMSAIDLCCGDGLFTVPMSILLDGHVYAIDLDRDMLRAAKKAMATANAPACQWIEGDARDMANLVQEKIDAVLIANTFHGVPNQTQLAESVLEVLKPGGRFSVINWHVLPREKTTVLGLPRGPRVDLRMSPDDVVKVVEPSGFVFKKTVELPPYHYGIIFQKP